MASLYLQDCNSLQRQSINNELHYEGTTDAAQPVPPSPGMDHDPSATLESSTILLAGACGRRVTCAAPRDYLKQGVHISAEEDTAKPVVSVAIFRTRTSS